tara:strand:- start:4893 stop:5666 length:774 start_codon:yes stop_codon:yes gene_type:complete
MLKKRLIGTITVLNGWAVQSFGFKRYLPLGRPQTLAKNLDNWGVDEIVIQSIDRTLLDKGPDLELLKSLGKLYLSTPLTYCGGIKNSRDAEKAIQAGCERISIDSLLHYGVDIVYDIASSIGSQALIASVPVSIIKDKLNWYDYKKNLNKTDFGNILKISKKNLISEFFLIDKNNEGNKNSFNEKILKLFPVKAQPLILFGGISEIEQIKKFFNEENISSIAIGNFLNYKEHMVQSYKKELGLPFIRDAIFKDFELI